jgi:hypothetical protein
MREAGGWVVCGLQGGASVRGGREREGGGVDVAVDAVDARVRWAVCCERTLC